MVGYPDETTRLSDESEEHPSLVSYRTFLASHIIAEPLQKRDRATVVENPSGLRDRGLERVFRTVLKVHGEFGILPARQRNRRKAERRRHAPDSVENGVRPMR